MKALLIRKLFASLAALGLMTGVAVAQQMKVTIAIGGAACLCYLPTVLAKHLGEYEKAGLNAEMVDFKGGSQALTAVLGGSADGVDVLFFDMKRENWSTGGVLWSDKAPPKPAT